MRAPTRVTELGVERFCRWCGEYWPLDATFWYFTGKGTVLGRCRACWAERISKCRQPPPNVGNYGEQLAAMGGVIDPEIERRLIEKGG